MGRDEEGEGMTIGVTEAYWRPKKISRCSKRLSMPTSSDEKDDGRALGWDTITSVFFHLHS